MTTPKCIVCSKPIKKRMRELSFYPATLNKRQNGERADHGRSIYLDEELRPTNKEEAQRYTNYPISRVIMDSRGKVISFTWWEGDYEDKYFHSQRCAALQGYAAADAGHRWKWNFPVDE